MVHDADQLVAGLRHIKRSLQDAREIAQEEGVTLYEEQLNLIVEYMAHVGRTKGIPNDVTRRFMIGVMIDAIKIGSSLNCDFPT